MLLVVLAWLVPTVSTHGKCDAGLSLLAHKSHIQKSPSEVPAELPDPAGDILIPSFSSYDWCHCGGVGYHCDLLQTDSTVLHPSPRLNLEQEASSGYNWTWQCHHELCGANYPASAYTCLDIQGTCVGPVGNCLYTTAWVVNTSEDCGYRKCFCATVPPGQCTSENFPGYIIVQNGAFNVTTGTRWYPEGDGKEYPPDLRSWEPVGGPGNHACRGDNSSDNDPKHYEVHNWIHSLWGCKDYCERTDFCTGIEYSAGRCEIWKRSRGIYHFKEIPVEKGEFTCLRYGWPTSKLVPVGPNGTSHPCRGKSSHDNHPQHYRVTWWHLMSTWQWKITGLVMVAALKDSG